MKKHIPIFVLLLLCSLLPFLSAPEHPLQQAAGTVVDLAMDDGLSYIGIRKEDGSGICVYFKKQQSRPEEIAIGDRVHATYQVLQLEKGQRYYAVEIKKITERRAAALLFSQIRQFSPIRSGSIWHILTCPQCVCKCFL